MLKLKTCEVLGLVLDEVSFFALLAVEVVLDDLADFFERVEYYHHLGIDARLQILEASDFLFCLFDKFLGYFSALFQVLPPFFHEGVTLTFLCFLRRLLWQVCPFLANSLLWNS